MGIVGLSDIGSSFACHTYVSILRHSLPGSLAAGVTRCRGHSLPWSTPGKATSPALNRFVGDEPQPAFCDAVDKPYPDYGEHDVAESQQEHGAGADNGTE